MNRSVSNVFKIVTQSRRVGLLALFLLVLAVHGNIFQNQFVMDDFDFIVNWPLIQDWSNIGRFFVAYTPPAGQEGVYSPLKTLFHAVNYHLFGLNPLGHHVMSLIIHCFGVYFIYRICLRLTSDAFTAFVSGLIFALHPVQVEAITYMTASIDMIGIVFLFVSLDFYMKARSEVDPLNQRSYLWAIIFAMLSVFTHELAISLPLLIIWYDICFPRRDDDFSKLIKRIQPFLTTVVVYVIIKYLVLDSITRGSYIADSFYLTMLVTLKAWAKYILLCLFPATLTHNHMIAPGISSFDQEDFDRIAVLTQSIYDTQALLSLAILGVLVYLAINSYQKDRLITFSLGFFFIALLPVSNLVPSGVYFGERYLYSGLLGFSLLGGIVIKRMYDHGRPLIRPVAVVILVALILVYSVRTWARNKEWNNEIVLFESAVTANSQSALMRTDLGLIYLKYGQPQKAIKSLREAIAIRPDDPVTYFSMAEAYVVMHKNEEAISALQEAIRREPEYAEAYFNLAGIYAKAEKKREARESLTKSIFYFRKQGRHKEAHEYEKIFNAYFNPIELIK